MGGGTAVEPVIKGNGFRILVDADGSLITGAVLGGPPPNPRGIESTAMGDGAFAFSGAIWNPSTYYQFWLVMTDMDGTVLWEKQYGTPVADHCRAIAATADGGYIMAGSTSYGPYHYMLLKTDADGDEMWRKYYATVSLLKHDIIEIPGGFLLSGQYNPGGEDEGNGIIITLDSQGNQEKVWTYGGNERDGFFSIEATAGGYILSGLYDLRPWILRINEEGDPVWDDVLDTPDTAYGYAARGTSDGGYVLLATPYAYGDGEEVIVARYNAAGTRLWTTSVRGPDYLAYDIIQTSDGGYAIAGTTRRSGGEFDWIPWILKLQPERFDTADLLSLLCEWGCESDCIYDLNGDLTVGEGDLAILLDNWQ